MRITVPKVRSEEKWNKVKGDAGKLVPSQPGKLTFQNYCRLSLLFLEVPNEAILNR